MTRSKRSVLLLILLTAVAGCGSLTPTAQHSVGRVTLRVTGGFTGWDRLLTVETDGVAHVQVVRGPSPAAGDQHVDPAVLARLHALVSEPAFARLDAAYLPPPGGADLQDYVVTAQVDGNALQTMTRDGANPPEILRNVLSILDGILVAASAHRAVGLPTAGSAARSSSQRHMGGEGEGLYPWHE